MHHTDRDRRARHAPATTGPQPRLPSLQALDAAGLTAVESGHDTRRHAVRQAQYAGEITGGHPGWILGLCGDVLLLGSLATEPAPACARCAAAPEVTGAAAAYAARGADVRPSRPLDRVVRRVRAVRLHAAEDR